MAGMEVFGWLSAALGLALFPWKSRRLWTVPVSDAGVVFFLIVAAIGLWVAPLDSATRWEALGSLRWIVLYFGLRAALTVGFKTEDLDSARGVLVALFVVLGGYAVLQHFWGVDLIRFDQADVAPMDEWPLGGSGKLYRAVGFLGSPMTFGHSWALWTALFAALVFADWDQNKRAAGTGWAFLFLVIALYCSYTRGAWLGAAAGVLLAAGFVQRRWMIRVLVGLGGAAVTLWVANESFRRRVEDLVSGQGHSAMDRWMIWKANAWLFLQHPWLGVGWGQNEALIGEAHRALGQVGQLGHAHNTWMQILSGTGILGAVGMVFFWGALPLVAVRAAHRDPAHRGWWIGLLAVQLALQVGGLTECNFKDAEVGHLFLFLMALLSSVSPIQERHTGRDL